MAAIRFKGTVIGFATNPSDPTIKITIQQPDSDTSGQFSLVFDNPVLAAPFPVGTAIFMDVTPSGSDETAIAAAVTLTPADTLD